MAIMISDHWLSALEAAGIADENTARVIIDLQCGHIPKVYIERIADDKLLEVLKTLEGFEVSRSDPTPHRKPCLSKPTEAEKYGSFLCHDHACMHDATDQHGTTLEHQCRCGKKWTTEPVGVSLIEPAAEPSEETAA